MKLPYFQIDAFTSRTFAGNPAGVCPLDHWIDDAAMQAIAEENNLSETAFVVGGKGVYELRWFTPVAEVELCGHATLASAFAIFEYLEPGRERVVFNTRYSGELGVVRENGRLEMDFPSLPPVPIDTSPAISQALGRTPEALLAAPRDYVAVFAAQRDIAELAPDFGRLAKLDRDAMIVTAPGDDVDFVSRFFAPKVGIAEDPVTGSAHCTLAPYWAARLGRIDLHGRQISARGGDVLCRLEGDRVFLGGTCALYLRGEIEA
ncbi:MAG: PhzF family phenazine biosynthesis protein [Proteobacteria bacterium]|nr:PhzF family phenazine biosynthesis protein [Pseudomonadota bacterium]